MDNFVDERDYKLIEGDKYTFIILRKIVDIGCRILLTDHERFILGYTGTPYPAWVWTPDDITDDEKEKAYSIVTEKFPLGEGYSYIMKYDLAEYFITRAKQEGKDLSIKTNMLAFDCPNVVPPKVLADGELYQCGVDDIDELVEFMDLFHKAVAIDQASLESYRKEIEGSIGKGCYFFWKK